MSVMLDVLYRQIWTWEVSTISTTVHRVGCHADSAQSQQSSREGGLHWAHVEKTKHLYNKASEIYG